MADSAAYSRGAERQFAVRFLNGSRVVSIESSPVCCPNCGRPSSSARDDGYCCAKCANEHRTRQSPSDEPAQKQPQFRSYERLDRLLSIDAVARWLNMSALQVEQMAEAGSLPARQLDGRWFFSAQVINSWLRAPYPQATSSDPVMAEQMANLDAGLDSLLIQVARIQTDLQVMLPTHRQPDSVGTLTSTGKEVAFALDTLLTLDELEAAYLRYVLQRCDGNKTVAAGRLRIDPSTLYRKLERLEERARAAGSDS